MLLFRFFKKLTYICNSLLNNKKIKRMNVQDYLNSKGIDLNNQKKVSKELLGKKVRVIANTSDHNMAIGTTFKVDMAYYGGTHHTSPFYRLDTKNSYSVMLTDIEMYELTKADFEESKKNLDEKINELQKEKVSIDSKIAFMQENNLEVYDEDLFKVNEVLKKLDDNSLTGIERAKVIASIIKG